MATIRINDAAIHYERTGAGDPSIVFVHGMCGGAWVWDDQVARLSDRFTCVAYDRRGHSRSGPGGGEQSAISHARDLMMLIEALDLDRPVVVGSSAGAVIALELLHLRPDLAAGAVLSEPPLFSIDPAVLDELMLAVGPALECASKSSDPGDLVEAFLGVVCPGVWERLDEGRHEAYRANAGLVMPTLNAVSSALTVEDLEAITVPTIALTGAQSVPGPRELTRRLAGILPDCRYVELAGASHATYLDAPEAFADAVATLADAVTPGAGTGRGPTGRGLVDAS